MAIVALLFFPCPISALTCLLCPNRQSKSVRRSFAAEVSPQWSLVLPLLCPVHWYYHRFGYGYCRRVQDTQHSLRSRNSSGGGGGGGGGNCTSSIVRNVGVCYRRNGAGCWASLVSNLVSSHAVISSRWPLDGEEKLRLHHLGRRLNRWRLRPMLIFSYDNMINCHICDSWLGPKNVSEILKQTACVSKVIWYKFRYAWRMCIYIEPKCFLLF